MTRALAGVLVLAALVTGCAAIPTDGPVTQGDVITDTTDTRVDFLPSAPRAGETQEQILDDFMQAVTSPNQRYEIARQYLAKSVRATWDPDKGVTIRTGTATRTPTAGTTDSYTYQFDSTSRVDAQGQYHDDGDASVRLDFHFVKEDGEWRISKLDDGIVLSADNFGVVFAEYPVYFFDPTYAYLVPDVRWFPQTSLIATRIASALAQGPADWLQGAVVSAFPTGAKVDNEVAVDSGVATVDLSDEVTDATPEQKARMRQQLAASLTSVPVVSSILLTVGGVPLTVDGGAAVQADADPSVGSLPLGLSGGAFGYVSSGGVSAVPGIAAAVAALKPLGVAYGAGSGVAAVRTGVGVYRVDANGQSRVIDARAGLIDPTMDPQGLIWTATASGPSSIVAVDRDASRHAVKVTGFADSDRLVALELSRDGTRALVVTTGTNGPHVYVAGVIRQARIPVQLGALVELASGGPVPLDATWIDGTDVATLTDFGTEASVTEYDLGGPSTSLGVVTGGEQMVGGNLGVDGLRVRSSTGELQRLRSSSWQGTGVSADVLATQYPQ